MCVLKCFRAVCRDISTVERINPFPWQPKFSSQHPLKEAQHHLKQQCQGLGSSSASTGICTQQTHTCRYRNERKSLRNASQVTWSLCLSSRFTLLWPMSPLMKTKGPSVESAHLLVNPGLAGAQSIFLDSALHPLRIPCAGPIISRKAQCLRCVSG